MKCARCGLPVVGNPAPIPMKDGTRRKVCRDCFDFLRFISGVHTPGKPPATSPGPSASRPVRPTVSRPGRSQGGPDEQSTAPEHLD